MDRNKRDLKQLLQCHRLDDQLGQIHFPLCKFTSTSLDQIKGIFPYFFLSSFLWSQIPGLSFKIRLLQAIRLELATCQSGKKDWPLVHEVALSWRSVYLIKVVLEGQAVYWMALAAIPATVLTKLRKLIFNFLWSGCSDHSRQHLCNWQALAKPKQKGGWGIQNLFHFSQALAANSLWRVLNLPGIWHSVILDKYLCHHTVNSWLLSETLPPDRPLSSGGISKIKTSDHSMALAGSQARGTQLHLVVIVSLEWMIRYIIPAADTHLHSKNLVPIPNP
jgi:hypothetical protein